MKNARPLLAILISVVVGAVAVMVAAQWLARQASVATTKVVVAARDLEVGTRLRADMLQLVDWPAGVALKESFSAPEKVYERVINTQVLRGEPIVAARLAPPGEKGGLSAVLGQGNRAITVKVNEIVGVAGFALPGNYVDVMVNTSDDANRPVSKIVLERILVLAVAQEVATGDTKPRVVNAVTLEVTPEQAERLDLARSVGNLSLVLRNQVDSNPTATAGITKAMLLRTSAEVPPTPTPAPVKVAARGRTYAKPRPAPVPSAKVCVEVIRGVNKTNECF
jgi:pilus assembly protein CpaB